MSVRKKNTFLLFIYLIYYHLVFLIVLLLLLFFYKNPFVDSYLYRSDPRFILNVLSLNRLCIRVFIKKKEKNVTVSVDFDLITLIKH